MEDKIKNKNINIKLEKILKNLSNNIKGKFLNIYEKFEHDTIRAHIIKLQNNTHPLLKDYIFSKNPIPPANINIYNSNTKNYSGCLFHPNTEIFLDITNQTEEHLSKLSQMYVTLEWLESIKLSKCVPAKYIKYIPLYNKNIKITKSNDSTISSSNHIAIINVAYLKYNKYHNQKGLSQKSFDRLFPNFKDHVKLSAKLSKERVINYNKNIIKSEADILSIENNVLSKIKNSHFPIFSLNYLNYYKEKMLGGV